jgi:hypothetical protein
LLFLGWLLIVLARTLWATYRAPIQAVYSALAVACGASIGAWLVDGLVDAPIRLGAKAGIEFWLILGLAFALPTLATAPRARPADAPPERVE